MNFYFYSKYNGKSTIEQLRRVTFFVSSSSFHIVYIRDFLGHSSVKTTEIYAKANIVEKIKTIQNLDKKENQNIKEWNEDKELMSWLESI